jgi:hypothetical protein
MPSADASGLGVSGASPAGDNAGAPGMATDENSPIKSDTPVVSTEEKMTGKAGEIKKIADDYVIPISDSAIKEWEKAGPEEFKKYAEQVACGMYPTFAPQIQAGLPTKVLLDPYIQVAQQVLGGNMKEPNWSDPKWSAALQGGIDPKTGRPIPMTLDEWRKHLMTSPGHGWEFTQHAHERSTHLARIIHNSFTGQGNV